MTERIRYATSHIHELGAEIQRRVLDGYILDTSSAFCIKRQGSAYVAHFLPTREVLDDVVNFDIDKMDQALKSDRIQVPHDLNMEDFDEFMKQCEPLPAELLDRMTKLREKAESNRALEELTQQAQELDMAYNKQLTIHQKWEIDDEINFEADEQKKVAESEGCGKMVYTKQELDALYWTDLQEVGRKFGVKQRDRKKLTRMILEAQEKENEEAAS